MDELSIIKPPERYSVSNERLGVALAKVSAQTCRLAEVHAALTDRQTEQEAQQKQFVEERVAEARCEAEARTQALVSAINQAYGDPGALERRVDDRIQRVLASLQEASLNQARALAESQLESQEAVYMALKDQVHTELVRIQEGASLKAEQSVQSVMDKMSSEHNILVKEQSMAASERYQMKSRIDQLEQRTDQFVNIAIGKAKDAVASGRDIRLEQALGQVEERIMSRMESRLLELMNSSMKETQKEYTQQLHRLQTSMEERFEQHLDERLREAVVVAKKAAGTEARRVVRETTASPSINHSDSYVAEHIESAIKSPASTSSLLMRARMQAQKEVTARARSRARELKSATASFNKATKTRLRSKPTSND